MEKTEWVIPIDPAGLANENCLMHIGVACKVTDVDYGCFQLNGSKCYWPKEHCIPCPEPLPEKWTVFADDVKWAHLVNFEEDSGLWLHSNGDTFEIPKSDYEHIDFMRWHFWHIGSGKEYREKNEGATLVNGQPFTQPDYRTLYEQAQKELESVMGIGRIMSRLINQQIADSQQQKALLEAADAVIEQHTQHLQHGEAYTHYQQLKAKQAQ